MGYARFSKNQSINQSIYPVYIIELFTLSPYFDYFLTESCTANKTSLILGDGIFLARVIDDPQCNHNETPSESRKAPELA